MFLIKDYKILFYKKSNQKNKKYAVTLENKKTKQKKVLNFGDNRYENYHDKTGLKLTKTHKDPKRRENYRKRHKRFLVPGYYTPAWFSYNILW